MCFATNVECDAVNLRRAIFAAYLLGVPVFAIQRSETYSNPFVEPGAFTLFHSQGPGRTLVNLAPHLKVANGTPVTMDSLTFDPKMGESELQELLQTIARAEPGEVIVLKSSQVAFIWVNVDASVQSDPTKRRVPLRFMKQQCGSLHGMVEARRGSTGKLDMATGGFPVDLAHAMTYHKLQGATLEKLIVCLNKARSGAATMQFSGLYVCATRVRTFANIRRLPGVAAQLAYVPGLRPDSDIAGFLSKQHIVNPIPGYSNVDDAADAEPGPVRHLIDTLPEDQTERNAALRAMWKPHIPPQAAESLPPQPPAAPAPKPAAKRIAPANPRGKKAIAAAAAVAVAAAPAAAVRRNPGRRAAPAPAAKRPTKKR
jgi:hypothetical protein